MRKYKRSMIRANAKAEKVKPSRWVKVVWEQLQSTKYGYKHREINKVKGTHKRSVCRQRIALLVKN